MPLIIENPVVVWPKAFPMSNNSTVMLSIELGDCEETSLILCPPLSVGFVKKTLFSRRVENLVSVIRGIKIRQSDSTLSKTQIRKTNHSK
jgi:hypothetical protein